MSDLPDDELLARLDQASRLIDPPPADLTEVALRAFTWDSELGELVRAAEAESVLVRNTTTGFLDFTFEIDDHVLDVSIVPVADSQDYRLTGLLNPRQESVDLIVPGQAVNTLVCDAFGRFEAVITHSPAIGFRRPDGSKVRTPLLDLP